MKTLMISLILITSLIALLGYGIYGVMKAQKEIQREYTQNTIERYPELEKFYK